MSSASAMILLLDNYDSFTYNLVQSLAGAGAEVVVHRNDTITVAEALDLNPSGVILSPGPGRPEKAGICLELLAALPAQVPMLGVCLGHQALVQSFGGGLELDPIPVHGKPSWVHYDSSCLLLQDLPEPFQAGRYHSLRATPTTLPQELQRVAWTESGLLMAVQHRSRPWFGLQFHPESILTPQGDQILQQFFSLTQASFSK